MLTWSRRTFNETPATASAWCRSGETYEASPAHRTSHRRQLPILPLYSARSELSDRWSPRCVSCPFCRCTYSDAPAVFSAWPPSSTVGWRAEDRTEGRSGEADSQPTISRLIVSNHIATLLNYRMAVSRWSDLLRIYKFPEMWHGEKISKAPFLAAGRQVTIRP